MPTTFHLKPAQVNTLRTLAGRLLEQSPEFRSFRSALAHDLDLGTTH